MEYFELDQRLKNDCLVLGDLPLVQIAEDA